MEVIEPHTTNFLESSMAREVTILCSICGCSFPPTTTSTNVCVKCISTQTDVTTGITKQAVLNFCRTCKRYLRPPCWVNAELESKELLALCLKRVRGLNKVKLVDASFIWTEPHSRRVKVKLTIQKEVMNNVTVQQTFPIEYVVFYQQCEDCKKEYTPHTWGALVQVRQKAEHKKTFFYLEQLILKYNAHDKVLRMKEMDEGVDFFYKEKSHAARLVDFLQSMFPVKVKTSKQLISQDFTNNTCNYKYVYSVDLPRICKDDLVVLKPKLAASLGGCSPVLICSKVATMIQFIDPINMKTIEIDGNKYFQSENDMTFIPAKGNATEFMVFGIDQCQAPKNGTQASNLKVARAQIGRTSDWNSFEVKTFLGDVLKEGSSALGFDLTMLNFSGDSDDSSLYRDLPEVILFRKYNPETKNLKKRIWRLKQLEKEEADTNAMRDQTKNAKDYEEFLNDLETDPEMRANINLYRNEKTIKEKEENKMEDENALGEISNRKHKSSGKKLKIKKTKKYPQVAAGGKDQDDKDPEENKDKDQDEGKITEKNKKEKREKDEEDDQMVKIEELLADMNLDDEEEIEDNGDVIDEFIRRLEKVKIEGKDE